MHIILHLDALSDSCHFCDHMRSLSKSVWRATQSWWEEISLKTVQSSAKRRVWEAKLLPMLLMYMMKSKDPRINPWGTPEVTFDQCEVLPSHTTRCLWCKRKPLIHANRSPWIPTWWSFKSNRWWVNLTQEHVDIPFRDRHVCHLNWTAGFCKFISQISNWV